MRPATSLASVFSPIGALVDKSRVAGLQYRVLKGSIEDRFRDPETTTLQARRENGFSDSTIDRLFRPFLGGILPDGDLMTTCRMFQFVFRMFSPGNACLPKEGMEAIPRQLAATLPSGGILFGAKVARVRSNGLTLESGEGPQANKVVVATDGAKAGSLPGDAEPAAWQGVKCLCFSAPAPPIVRLILVPNGDAAGPIKNLCVPTTVAPSCGPSGSSLIAVPVPDTPPDAAALQAKVQTQLNECFGDRRKVGGACGRTAFPMRCPGNPRPDSPRWSGRFERERACASAATTPPSTARWFRAGGAPRVYRKKYVNERRTDEP